MKSINWKDHLVNLFVVIIGITIAFALNNWKESRDHAKSENEYLKNIISEVTKDMKNLENNSKIDSQAIQAIEKILVLTDSVHNDSLENYFSSIFTLTLFVPQNITFESIKASGKLDYIKDLDIRNAMVELYQSTYRGINEAESYYRANLDNKIIPFMMANSDFSSTLLEKEVLPTNNREFRNMLVIHRSMIQLKIGHSLEGINKCKEIKQSLQEYLNG